MTKPARSKDSDQPVHLCSLISLPCLHESSIASELYQEKLAKILTRLVTGFVNPVSDLTGQNYLPG